MADVAAQASARNMVRLLGRTVTFQRLTGAAPNVVIVSATITARVRGYSVDGNGPATEGYSASLEGSISQTARKIVFVTADLAAAGFPLPIVKNDKVVLADGTKANVTEVDMHKRSFTGMTEITVSEIA